MKVSCLFACLIVLPATGGCTQPAGMYQKAQVRVVDSRPCFAVADSEESRRTPPVVGAVSVDRFTGSDWEYVWAWITPLDPVVRLGPDQCVPFGTPLIAGGSNHVQALLQPGERYHVGINSQISNPSPVGDAMVGRMYGRDFCLGVDVGGEVAVVYVPTVAGERQWDVCEE